jgi:hypothetical protein
MTFLYYNGHRLAYPMVIKIVCDGQMNPSSAVVINSSSTIYNDLY